MVGTSVARLGAIAPGQSVPVRLAPEGAKALRPYTPLSAVLFGKPRQPHPQNPSNFYTDSYEVPRDPETRRRARLIDGIVGRESYSSSWSMPLTFFAFTQAPTTSDVVTKRGGNVHE